MRYPHDHYHDALILNLCDHAMVTHSPAPEASPVADQRLAEVARVFERSDTVFEGFEYTRGWLSPQFL